MNVPQFIMSIYVWLMADPTHLVAAASMLAAITPTPNPATPYGKAYKVLEVLAMNFLHAKDTGVTVATALAQVQAAVDKKE